MDAILEALRGATALFISWVIIVGGFRIVKSLYILLFDNSVSSRFRWFIKYYRKSFKNCVITKTEKDRVMLETTIEDQKLKRIKTTSIKNTLEIWLLHDATYTIEWRCSLDDCLHKTWYVKSSDNQYEMFKRIQAETAFIFSTNIADIITKLGLVKEEREENESENIFLEDQQVLEETELSLEEKEALFHFVFILFKNAAHISQRYYDSTKILANPLLTGHLDSYLKYLGLTESEAMNATLKDTAALFNIVANIKNKKEMNNFFFTCSILLDYCDDNTNCYFSYCIKEFGYSEEEVKRMIEE